MSDSITILGSSSGMPQPDRACSGYLLKTGDSLSLFDCGSGVVSSFLRCGFDPIKLDRVFISHTHSDHVSDLTLLIQTLHGRSSGRKLEIYLPEEFVAPFAAYLPAVYLPPQRLRLDLEIIGFSEGTVFSGDLHVSAVPNSHQAKLRDEMKRLGFANKGQSFSFRIEIGEKSVLYSADLGSFADIRDHLEDVDYVIVETTHVDLQEILDHARQSTVGAYVLTHLGNSEEVAVLRQQVKDSGLKNMLIAEDGLRLEI
ncbi:MAG: MBL fold metallo-hydrolase [bacterium]|nr:MBL fold metallo-hydrolase [bacterium]